MFPFTDELYWLWSIKSRTWSVNKRSQNMISEIVWADKETIKTSQQQIVMLSRLFSRMVTPFLTLKLNKLQISYSKKVLSQPLHVQPWLCGVRVTIKTLPLPLHYLFFWRLDLSERGACWLLGPMSLRDCRSPTFRGRHTAPAGRAKIPPPPERRDTQVYRAPFWRFAAHRADL